MAAVAIIPSRYGAAALKPAYKSLPVPHMFFATDAMCIPVWTFWPILLKNDDDDC